MLKAQKKLTKKRIKEDKLVTFYFKSQDFLKHNGRQILSGVGALMLVFLLAVIYKSKQGEKEHNAIVELTKAKLKYFENDYSAAVPILKNLIEEYGGTESGQEGRFYLANSFFNLGTFAQAEQYFNEFLKHDGDDILSASAMAGVAACLEEQKNYERAAKLYREAAEKYRNNFMTPQNLYNCARCYHLAGNPDEARRALTELIEKYADASIKNEAELLLSELTS